MARERLKKPEFQLAREAPLRSAARMVPARPSVSEKVSFSCDVWASVLAGRKGSLIYRQTIPLVPASRAPDQRSSQSLSRSRARDAICFSREHLSRPTLSRQLGSFECQRRDSPAENFHSANAPGNLAMPDRSTMSRRRECFESRKQLECCRLRESAPHLCRMPFLARAARLY